MSTPILSTTVAQLSPPATAARGHRTVPLWLSMALIASLAGCMNLAPPTRTPALPVPATVGTGAEAEPVQPTPHSLEQTAALTWVQSAKLRQVLALALANNRDLRLALTNIEKARAQYGVQQADQLPTVAGSAQANRSQAAQDLTAAGRNRTTSQFVAQIGFAS